MDGLMDAERQVRVVARESLIAAAVAALEQRDSAVCLVGEAGIGKSTAWAATLQRTQRPILARLNCFEAESGLGWVCAAELVTAIGDKLGSDALAALPAAQRQAVD